MDGMDQKFSCARLVLLVILHLALCFLPCLQARDARHQGRHGPGGQLPRGVQKTRFYWEIFYVSVHTAMLGLRVTSYASAYGCFWEEFPTFS